MRATSLLVSLLALLAGAGCTQRMADQPRYEPLEASAWFSDGQSSRGSVPGTVARDDVADDAMRLGLRDGVEIDRSPVPVTAELVARGRQRYDIHCAPCHDRAGTGHGMVVRHGFAPPPSLHEPRLLAAPDGHFVRVMAQGLGAMPDYAARVGVQDRWAIAAYVRALQLSQHARIDDVPPDVRGMLEPPP